MAFSDKGVHTLTRLGLTQWQAKVYLALARSGTATVKTTSDFSGIPRQHIYKIVSALQEFGLVTNTITRPIMFKAIPLKDGLSILMKRQIKKISELKIETRELLKNSENDEVEKMPREEMRQFTLISGKDAVLKIRGKFFERAKKSVDDINSWKRLPLTAYTYFEVHKEMWQRGVESRVIYDIPCDKKSRSLLKKLASQRMKHSKIGSHNTRYLLGQPKALVTIVDKKEALVDTLATTDAGESPLLWSNNPSLLSILQEYFEMIWSSALEEMPGEH